MVQAKIDVGRIIAARSAVTTDPARWQRISQLCEAALAREAQKRASKASQTFESWNQIAG
jgi:hypothetical protein